MKNLSLLTVVFSVFFVFPKTVYAVYINEVYPQPATDEKEWIELFNDSDESIDLSNWKLMDKISTPSVIFELVSTNIEPLSYFVIELPLSKLNNAGDSVRLLDQNDTLIDEFGYENSASMKSFSLIEIDGENSIQLTTPTKGELNQVEEGEPDDDSNQESNENDLPTSYPSLLISEVMACPTSENPEWIKILNPNQDAVSLYNWRATDEADNEIELPEAAVIESLDSTTVILESKLLNNSGDVISLFSPNNELVDQFEYSSCTTGVVLGANESSTSYLKDENEPNGEVSNGKNEDNSNENSSNPEKNELQTSDNSQTETAKEKHLKINQQLFKPQIQLEQIAREPKNKRVSITHNRRSIYPILSVIIGGMITSSSGLVFIKKKS